MGLMVEPCAGAGRSESQPIQVDVLVVGFGPVGAVVANLLGRYGVRTLVVDKATEIFVAPRAIALDNEALRVLQLAGLDDDAFAKSPIPYVRMRSPQLGEFGRVNTLGSIDGHPKLVTFYQPELERVLRDALQAYPSVDTMLGVRLEGLESNAKSNTDGVAAALILPNGEQLTVHARYLVGADGASSLVRQIIGQEFKGKTFAEDWLIVDARNVAKPIDHVEFLCDYRRPTPHMTAPGGRERWEFMLRHGETREQMESDASIRELLAPWGGPERMEIERRAVYRFHARCADAFSKGPVFLVGDAAHITPPFVGQGLVAGLRDAANLCWKLAWVVHGRASAGILDSYDRERRPHAKAMIRLAQFMGKLVMPRNAGVAMLTHGFMRLTRLIPGLREYIEELGIKPKNAYAQGLFVRGKGGKRLRRGAMLPQGWLRDARGGVDRSDEALGSQLSLIGFGADPGAWLDSATRAAFETAGGRMLQIAQSGRLNPAAGAGRTPVWEDLNGSFLPAVVPHGWAAVVRPDGFVMHDGPIAAVDRLVRESLTLLGASQATQASARMEVPA